MVDKIEPKKVVIEFIFWFIALAVFHLISLYLKYLYTPEYFINRKHGFVFLVFEGNFISAIALSLLNRFLQIILKRVN